MVPYRRVGNIDTLDQELEIIVGARDGSGTLYCLNPDASAVAGWPITLGSQIESAPTLADLDSPPNGDLEVIVACGSQVHVRRSDGTVFPGWPQTIGCANVLFTSPCVANFENSDEELEIAVCGGTDTLYVFNATGSLEWKERVIGNFVWAPLSCGDLDWDGAPEILVQTWHASQSRLYAFKGDGTAPAGWETPIQVGLQARSGAALGDLDGDGRLEVLVGDGNFGYVYGYASNGTALPGAWSSGVPIASRVYSPLCLADLDGSGSCSVIVLGINNDKMNVVDQNGMVLESWSRALDGDCYGAPCIADIDLDGDTEILLGTDAGTVFCFDFGGTYSPLRLEYPKFQADLGNTGRYTEEIPPQPPTVETIEVVNGDELQLTWNTVSTDSLSRQELVTTYRIYRGTDAYFDVGTGSLLGSVSRPETTFVDVTTGIVGDGSTNYSYAVTALDQHGNESQASNRIGEHDFTSSGRSREGERDRKQLRPRSR